MPAKPKTAAKSAAKPKTAAKPAPKQSYRHPTLEAWLAQPENVLRLQQIIADPVFIAACHYVESTVNVNPDDLIGAKAALEEVIVRKAAMAAGVRIFTATITALPKFRSGHADANPIPWDYIQAPNL